MYEAKLRVECSDVRSIDNPYYGKSVSTKVKEETITHEFDKRENIAPCGIVAKIKVGESTLDIKVNRYYFDHEDSNSYVAFFEIEEKVYELWVRFDGKQLINITLSEWLESGSFEDGDDADNIYHSEDFEEIDIYES